MDIKELVKCLPGYDPYDDCEGFFLDEDRATRAIGFIEDMLTFTKGAKAGQNIDLEIGQKALIANIFGWVDADGFRRFKEVFYFIPRKNGKTTICACIANLVLFCDGEPGAEIYSAASERDQAAIIFEIAKRQVENNPELEESCNILKKSIVLEEMGSSFKAISSDAKSKHGYDSHCVLIDELHAHKNPTLVEVLETSVGARRESLIIYLTTSDYDRPSICNTKLKYAKEVRDGVIPDPRFLPVIYEADLEDDWHDEEIWKKANPNLGVSVRWDYFRREYKKACHTPSYENTFRRLHLNTKTEQAKRWISLQAWDACGEIVIPFDELLGHPCFGGLDLSSTVDTTSFVLWFPHNDAVLAYFWIPKENVIARQKKDKVHYLAWEKEGFLTMTEGNVVDYDFVKADILKLSEQFDIREIGYDPYNCRQIAVGMQEKDGLPMVEFRQGWISMNEPCKLMERKILQGTLAHRKHPVLRWQMGNIAIRSNPSMNIRIDKEKSIDKVDGPVSLAMALGCGMINGGTEDSAYEERGIISI